jgi:phosphatidylserine/phosphatidylglycerophosphate/cardiolipin synthase-like enzyme
MVEHGLFGPTSPVATPHRQLIVNDVLIETFFGPEERIAPVLATLIASAEQEILFLAFSFTHEEIGEAMLAQARGGVTVRGVFETTGSATPFSYYGRMRDAPLPTIEVRTDGNPRIMHHKVLVIDREVVAFGSFNFSASANNSNDENVLIVYDPEFASYFVEEFGFIWNEASS